MRIVSLLPSSTEIVCALGLEDALVGITHECDYPPSVAGKSRLTSSHISHETMTSAEIDHAVRSQLDGHGSIYHLDEARLRELKPDLILTQELCEVCAVSYKTVERAARMFEADVTVVSLEPNTIADIFDNIRTVGKLTGRESEADDLVRSLSARLDRIREKTAGIERRPRTLMLEWLEPPFAPGHWVPEQVAIAGGDHAFGEAGQRSVTTNAEEIVAYSPEVIVLIPCGYYKEDIFRRVSNNLFRICGHTALTCFAKCVIATGNCNLFGHPVAGGKRRFQPFQHQCSRATLDARRLLSDAIEPRAEAANKIVGFALAAREFTDR